MPIQPNKKFHRSLKTEINKTLSLSVPLIASQIVYASSSFIGTTMVARLGADALAASILVSMSWFALSVFFFGILNAVSVLISHQFGAKNHVAMSETMGHAVLLGVVVCVLLVFALLALPFILRLSAQPSTVLQLSIEYTHALIWTIPGLVALVIYEQFLAGIGRAQIVLRISLVIVPIEILLIYLLIFGKYGLPQCGVAGVGYGFSITYTVTAIGLVCYLALAQQYRPYGIFSKINQINTACLKHFISVGLPMGFMHVIEVTAFTIATYWIGWFGTDMLAAHQITMQYFGLAITLVFAMSQAVTVRVGHVIGEKNLAGVPYAIYVGMIINFCCISLIAIGFFMFPHFFIKLDLDVQNPMNGNLAETAAALLSIAGVLILLDNFRIICFGALRGLKDTQFPMCSSLVGFWIIGLSSAYLLGYYFNFTGKGVWWGLTLGIASGAIMVFWRLQYLLRRLDILF